MTGFEGYLKDFEGARGEALQAIDAYANCKDPQRREELVVEARNCIDEVERYIRVLENEVKETKDVKAKRQMDPQVRHCHTQHASLKSSLEKAILIGDARKKAVDTAPISLDQKEEGVRYAERLDRNGRHLDEAQRTLAETEAIGAYWTGSVDVSILSLTTPTDCSVLCRWADPTAANTANNLLQQRNQLQHTEMNVEQAQVDTDEAKSHLRRLTVKALTNKIVLLLIMLILAAAIAVMSYYKWYPRNKKDYLGILPTPTPTAVAPAPSTP